jgi:cytoskeletal protein CcmA (bactofilin family)
VTIRDDQASDLYAAGRQVVLEGDVYGDAVLAGGTVRVDGKVSDDLIAAGGTVAVNGDVSDDLRVAGGEVTLASEVAGHAVISGGSVVVESSATIADWAWIAAGSVEVAGAVNGELRVAAREIELSGRVDGDVELAGGEIEIEDGAVINGDLTWRSSEQPEIGEDVTITGEIIEGEPLPGFERDPMLALFRTLFSLLSLIVAAIVFYAVFRVPIDRCVAGFRASRNQTFLSGAGVLLITPVAVLLLFLTGFAWRLALLLLLAYGLAIGCGGLMGIALVARWGLDRARPGSDSSLRATWPAIVVVAVLLALLDLIPLVGGLATSLVLLIGLGAMSKEIYRSLRGDRA